MNVTPTQMQTPVDAGKATAISVVVLVFPFLVVLAGAAFGCFFFEATGSRREKPGSFLGAISNWDGRWYTQIAVQGYQYEEGNQSNVAFFPAYPSIAAFLRAITGIRLEAALAATANAALGLFLATWAIYLRGRVTPDSAAFPCAQTSDQWSLVSWALVATATVPVSMWWRMAYSESTFLLIGALALLAMQRRWPLFLIALIIGLGTATRPVGVCLLLPFGLHLWQELPQHRWRMLPAAALLIAASWGILAYMTYLGFEFGEPLAFAKTQAYWRFRPPTSSAEKIISLAALEPIWSVYVPSSPAYWASGQATTFLFSLQFFNPIYFMGAVVLLLIGIHKRWLESKESLLCAGLLLVPYLTRSHEMYMEGMGRFAGAAFPLYIVLGRLYQALPPSLTALIVGVSCFFLGVYAALFASAHRFI